MSRKVVLFIATSLDGFIAREDGSLDWLFEAEAVGEGDNGFAEFYQTIDTMLMGRATYDQLMTLVEGKFPHADRECYVFSRSRRAPDPYVKFVNEDVVQFTRELKQRDGKNIWLVGGAGLIDPLHKARLIDEYIITIVPVMLGKGIPLFLNDNPEMKLVLKGHALYGQFVSLHYEAK
jgi:dihydrofolate reductase